MLHSTRVRLAIAQSLIFFLTWWHYSPTLSGNLLAKPRPRARERRARKWCNSGRSANESKSISWSGDNCQLLIPNQGANRIQSWIASWHARKRPRSFKLRAKSYSLGRAHKLLSHYFWRLSNKAWVMELEQQQQFNSFMAGSMYLKVRFNIFSSFYQLRRWATFNSCNPLAGIRATLKRARLFRLNTDSGLMPELTTTLTQWSR